MSNAAPMTVLARFVAEDLVRSGKTVQDLTDDQLLDEIVKTTTTGAAAAMGSGAWNRRAMLAQRGGAWAWAKSDASIARFRAMIAQWTIDDRERLSKEA